MGASGSRRVRAALLSVAAGATLFSASPASADALGLGAAVIGALILGSMRQGGQPPRRAQPARQSRRGSGDGSGRSERDTRVLASLAPPSTQTQLAVLKSIVPSATLGAVGTTESAAKLGQTRSDESNRDTAAAIATLIEHFKRESVESKRDGDVTQHSIQEALDEAFKKAGLQRFESFSAENWSGERLRVMILTRVANEVGSLLQGTNRGNVQMAELAKLIDKSAQSVHSRLFEISELLAANRSSTLFFQRLYQVNGELANGELGEDAEQLLARGAAPVAGEYDGLLRRDPNGFALRYRLKRVVFDCLTENVERITLANRGMATRDEVAQRIGTLGGGECRTWVAAQFRSAEGKLKPQEPMPLRAGWTANGPKDDPSMYGSSTSQM